MSRELELMVCVCRLVASRGGPHEAGQVRGGGLARGTYE